MRQTKKRSKIEAEIESNLKRAFDDVLNEDVPDRFKDLLAQLSAEGTKTSDARGGNRDE